MVQWTCEEDAEENSVTGKLEDVSEDNTEDLEWKPLLISFVEYPQGDYLGLFYALSSFFPAVLAISFATLILFRRDLFTIAFFLGYLLNEPANQISKRILKEPRPVGSRRTNGAYGMPSSHSQHAWFFTTFAIIFLLIRVPEGSAMEHIGLILALVMSSSAVGYGRIYLKYHTWQQVIVGGIVGCIFAGIWFSIIHIFITPWFPSIVSWSISKYFLIRDYTSIPHLFSFEYTNVINYKPENRLPMMDE